MQYHTVPSPDVDLAAGEVTSATISERSPQFIYLETLCIPFKPQGLVGNCAAAYKASAHYIYSSVINVY